MSSELVILLAACLVIVLLAGLALALNGRWQRAEREAARQRSLRELADAALSSEMDDTNRLRRRLRGARKQLARRGQEVALLEDQLTEERHRVRRLMRARKREAQQTPQELADELPGEVLRALAAAPVEGVIRRNLENHARRRLVVLGWPEKDGVARAVAEEIMAGADGPELDDEVE